MLGSDPRWRARGLILNDKILNLMTTRDKIASYPGVQLSPFALFYSLVSFYIKINKYLTQKYNLRLWNWLQKRC